MVEPVSPRVEANLSSRASDSQTDLIPASPPAPPVSYRVSEGLSLPTLIDVQEKIREYVHESFRSLESQWKVDQQRQRDRVEDEIHKMCQQLAATAEEQRQHHQNMSAVVREMFEDMRKELSNVLHRLSQDMDHTLRQSEAHNQQAIEKLRDEMLRVLFERDQTTVKREALGELLVTIGKQLQTPQEGQAR